MFFNTKYINKHTYAHTQSLLILVRNWPLVVYNEPSTATIIIMIITRVKVLLILFLYLARLSGILVAHASPRLVARSCSLLLVCYNFFWAFYPFACVHVDSLSCFDWSTMTTATEHTEHVSPIQILISP